MEPYRFAVAASLAVAFAASPLGPTLLDHVSRAPAAMHRRAETVRLRAHFDSVDAELRAADASRLDPGARAARTTLMAWLRDYSRAARFPVNDRFADRAMPFFRDTRGSLCAMAYLIDRSGRGDLVDRIARTRNNAFLPELGDDGDLLAWLDSVGLTAAEAARIQPTYGPPPPTVEDDEVSAGYALTSMLVSGVSLTTVGLNLVSPSRSTGWAGVFAGTAALIAGVANLDGPGDSEVVAAANMIVGAGAVAVGATRLMRPARSDGYAVGPAVVSTSRGARLGLAVRASF